MDDHQYPFINYYHFQHFGKRQRKGKKLIVTLHFKQINENNFIIIIDMSSGLISSLFRDNSFASRSSSLFNKSLLPRQNNQERARSHSVYMDKNPNSNMGNQYLPVGRMVHTLAVKIKKLNYFLFCRLQANLKKWKADNPETEKKNYNQIIPVSVIPVSVIENKKSNQLPIQKLERQENIGKGLQNLAEFLQLYRLKQQSCIEIQQYFKKLKRFSKKKQSAAKFINIITSNRTNKIHLAFKRLQSYQKFLLRSEIFSEAGIHILQPKIKQIFRTIHKFSVLKRQQQLIINQKKEKSLRKQKQIQKQEQKKQEDLLLNISKHIGILNERLKSIQQQNSSILSEEETARFVTPEKNPHKQKKSYLEGERLKTSRKQPRNSFLTRKDTKKQYQEPEQQSLPSVNRSNRKINHEAQDRFRYSAQKISTKIQPHRPKVSLLKAYKVQTSLIDNRKIKLATLDHKDELKQFMLKNNRLYSESLPNMLPDLHDNMGVFQDMWAEQGVYTCAEEIVLSHRTVQKHKKNFIQIQNNKTVSHCKETFQKQDVIYLNQQLQVSGLKQKQIFDKRRSTISSRAMTSSIGSPKFGIQNSGVTTIQNTKQLKQLKQLKQQRSGASSTNQFYSSPLYKIQQMMIDLQRLRQKQKFGCKYANGYQKCKISVNLPSKKSYEGRSYQCSANRTSNTSSSKNIPNQCKSDKKQLKELRKEIQKRGSGSHKQNRESKQNIQVKLWDQKQKFLFYAEPKNAQKMKQRKKSAGIISTSTNQNQVNTARKMKKQIQTIINKRNRISLGNLRLLKGKY